MEAKTNRPPIVTVLGHVDHGKTTLLDAIRKTHIASKEAGGITQSIGASVVTTKKGNKITFIDTPGHAAFSKMRSRGARVADIAVLVVAAEDGVKPQTVEALEAVKKAKIPFIVAITKIDLPSADVEGARGQLEKLGVSFEGRGGDTPLVKVSGKTGQGVDELLETMVLLSEVSDIAADPNGPLTAVVIETQKDKKGPLASVIVRNGTLEVGEEVSTKETSCKIKGIFGADGSSVKDVLPGYPAQILGFSDLPAVGSEIKDTAEAPGGKEPQVTKKSKGSLDADQIPVIIKAKNTGSLEAILANLPSQIVVIDFSVGDVFESDVLLARASSVQRVFGFEVKVAPSVIRLAEAEGVKIETFDVIYELFKRLEEIIKKGKKEILGKAEILAEFPFNNKKVAGCKVITGRIAKGDQLILTRGEKEVGKIKAVSIKKQKQEITEAKAGEEFGILFEPQLDFVIGDMIVSVAK